MITFPHANNETVSIDDFAEAWKRHCSQQFHADLWREYKIPLLHQKECWDAMVLAGRRAGFDCMCRLIVSCWYMDTMHPTPRFFQVNRRWLTRVDDAVSPTTGRYVLGAKLTGAFLREIYTLP